MSLVRDWREHPSGALADAMRLLAGVSALVTLGSEPTEVPLRFGLIAGLLLATRWIGMPRPFDAAFATMLLTTAWASALGWYVEHPWVDIPIHFALTGATAAMLYFALARLDLLPKPRHPTLRTSVGAIVLLVTLLGATAGVLWEIYEWLAENYLPSRILVGYDDTVGDLTNGTLGSVVAGGLMAWWQRAGHGLRPRR